MKSRKFKWGNPLFVAFLAIAGIFSVSSALINSERQSTVAYGAAERLNNNSDVYVHFDINYYGETWDADGCRLIFEGWQNSNYWGTNYWYNLSNITVLGDSNGKIFRAHITDNINSGKFLKVDPNNSNCYGKCEYGNLYDAGFSNVYGTTSQPISGTQASEGGFQSTSNNIFSCRVNSADHGVVTVNWNSNTGSKASEGSTTYIRNGNTYDINLTPDKGWIVSSVSVTSTTSRDLGVTLNKVTDTHYTFTGVDDECQVTATFENPWDTRSIEYSFNNGSTWNNLTAQSVPAGKDWVAYYKASSVSYTSGNVLSLRYKATGDANYTTISSSSMARVPGEGANNFEVVGGDLSVRYSNVVGDLDIRVDYESGAYKFYVWGKGITQTSDNGRFFNLIRIDSSGNKHYAGFTSTKGSGTSQEWYIEGGGYQLYAGDTIRVLNEKSENSTNYGDEYSAWKDDALKDNSEITRPSGDLVVQTTGAYHLYIKYNSYGSDVNTIYYSRKTRIVSFNMNGHGTQISPENFVTYDSTVSEPTQPTAVGYKFDGWYKEPECTNIWTFASDTVTSDMTLYAKWSLKQSALTFNLNDGSGTAATGLTATYGSAMPSYTQSAPTKTGYDFAGFYDGSGGTGTQYYTDALVSARNWDKDTTSGTILYAKWTAKVLTLSLDNQEATDAGSSAIYLKYDTGYYKESGCTNQITASANNITVPTKSNCTFEGYWTEPGGTGTQVLASNGRLVNDSVSKQLFSADGTLYAKWTFTIAYNANSGSGTTSSTTLTYGKAGTLATNAFSAPNAGHIFGTWNTKSTGDGTNYNSGASLSADQVTSLANSSTRTLYAKWTSGEADAIEYAKAFNAAVGDICKSYNSNTKDSFISIWNTNGTASKMEYNYNQLPTYVKYWIVESPSADDSISAYDGLLSKYNYVLSKYGYGTGTGDLHDFLNKKPAPKGAVASFSPLSLFAEEDDLSTIIIIASSSVALLSVTALSILVIKKRKNKEE